ncbi:hypothetical protein BT96DRAFT_1008479 [Gymnopus androsaceus JB14]|uniref:Uncharacterized protein n=1 Tax=Gymnopus androsaceus JB14 TaxID=1447944 RepID=A0A6A4GF13_9AGAR|nr:hypothetical protein BT96DRAFT_1008479 [Gymnopus androsaceus JB14]
MTGLTPTTTPPSTPTKKSLAEARRNAAIKKAFEDLVMTPSCLTHQEHVERVQQLQEVTKHATALQELEEARAKAQYRLEDVEEDLEEAFGKASATIGNPPSSPAKAERVREEPPQAIPIVSGGCVDLSAILSAPSPFQSTRKRN